jgi:hypothetical protein
LHAPQTRAGVDHEVIARVFAEREKDPVPLEAKREHDRERRLVADVLRVFHTVNDASSLGQAVSKTDNIDSAYYSGTPE